MIETRPKARVSLISFLEPLQAPRLQLRRWAWMREYERHLWSAARTLIVLVLAAVPGSRSAEAQSIVVARYQLDARSLVDGSREELSYVWEPRAIPSGGVSFTEIGEPVLRLFGSDGRSLGNIGSRGAGPGEFRLITGHGWLGDTVWVTDRQLRRTTYFTRDGKLLRIVAWPKELLLSASPGRALRHMRPPVPAGYLPNGSLLMGVHFGQSDPTSAGFPAGTDYVLFRTDTLGLILNEIVKADRLTVCSAQWLGDKTGGSIPIPYCPRHFVATSPTGIRSVLAEQGGGLADGQARLLVKDSQGKTLADVTLALPVIRVTAQLFDEEIARIQRVISPSSPTEQRAAIDNMPRAKVFPAFGKVLVADDGVVWLQRWTRSGAQTWVRVHPEQNREVVPVELPDGFTPFSLWRNGVWGTMRDADDVPSVGFAFRRG